MTAARQFRVVDAADRLAIAASAACLIHCLALPLLLAALPVLSRVVQFPELLHLWLVAAAVPISGYALLAGGVRRSDRRPLLIGVVGLGLLVIGAFGVREPALETLVTVAGGLLVVGAHVLNWQRRHVDKVIGQ